MSLIYAGGVQATALSNITSAINARIATQSDGTKALSTQSLIQWVLGQLQQMLSDAEATDTTFVNSLDPSSIVQQLAGIIAPTHWASRSDWPAWTVTQNQTASQLLAATQIHMAAVKRASDAVTAHYADTANGYYGIVNDYLSSTIEPTITPGVDPLVENRVYVATYVTDRDEESAPSDATDVIELDANDTVTITVPAPPSGRHVTHFRLYRSSSSNSGSLFRYVPNPADDDGWPIGTLTITDDKKAVELQEELPSLLWDEPPSDLQGLVGGANGGMAGFRGNEFCPCVPYKGYAFPAALRITTEFPIVGLGASGQDYFVGTRGRPSIISGADTQSLSHIKLDSDQACVSRRSIVAMRGGFLYASPDGLCAADQSGVRVITGPAGFNLFDRTAWQALSPDSIFAAENEGCYVFHWDNGTDSGVYSLDLSSGKLVALTNEGSAFYRDAVTDRLYIATGTQIKAIGGGTGMRTAVWRTPKIVTGTEVSHSWVQAESDFEAPVTVKTYLNEVLIDTTVLADGEAQRLPDGVGREWEVQVESAARVTKVKLASNTEELKEL